MSYLPLSNLGILTNQNYLKNPDAESSTSGFNVGSVTLSSGIPTGAPTIGSVTGFSLTRDTTNRLVGGASFEITAGSGGTTPAGAAIISDIITINDIDLAKVLSFGFGYKLVTDGANLDFSGSATQSMELWVYNIGLAEWIQPQGYRGINTKNAVGKVTATFQSDSLNTSNRNQYRLAIIFKNSISSLTEFVFDQAFLNNSPTLFGAAVTDWQAYTPTFGAGFGTPTNVAMYYRRVGDSVEVVGSFNTGTITANLSSISLPTGLSIDTAKISLQNTTASSGMQVGQSQQSVTGGAQTLRAIVTATGTNASLVYVGDIIQYTSPSRPGALVPSTTGIDYGASLTSVSFKVPVAGWSSNVSMAESSTFSISSYLANGTRVTTTPTKLGEYRSYRRLANSTTFTETDASPAVVPSSTDGIYIYNSANFNSNDANNEPSRYEIFVGKNKNVNILFYASANRTGFVDTTPGAPNANANYGYFKNYDPSTGIYSITPVIFQGGTAAHSSGLSITTSPVNDVYFDIIVSENALQVGMEGPRILGTAYAESSQVGNSSTGIPVDDSIPQISEGGEVISVTYTPKNPGSYLKINYGSHLSEPSNTDDTLTLALFRSDSTNAIHACYVDATGASFPSLTDGSLSGFVRILAGTTNTITFSLRAGGSGNGCYWNSTAGSTSRRFGTMPKTTIYIEEILG